MPLIGVAWIKVVVYTWAGEVYSNLREDINGNENLYHHMDLTLKKKGSVRCNPTNSCF